tara:strand:+ start:1086 stop:1364 length:279 start_codon:yes stop_codon:yes gene_type:complete
MEDFDDDEWAEMQGMYISHTLKELNTIKEDIESTTYDSLRTFGHNIKGSGGMYGFNEITDMGANIESAAKDSDIDKIKSNLETLEIFLKSKL